MQKFSEKVLAPNVHMSKKASPFHPHSQGLVYTPKGKPEVLPIDTADAGYGGATVADAEGGDADPGIASKKAVSPMKMQTLVKAKVNKEETERERLMKLRQFAAKGRKMGLGKAMVEEEQINEMDKSQLAAGRDSDTPFPKPKPIKLTDKQRASARLMTKELLNQAKKQLKKEEVEQVDELSKSTLASYAKKATDDVSYHSFMAGTMSAKDPERLATDKKAMKRQTGVIKAVDKLAKEEVEAVEEATGVTDYNPKSKGGTRAELLAKLAKSKNPEHATAARKAGATQSELKAAMVREENDGTEADQGEYGYEGDMAMSQLKSIIRNAKELHDMMEPQTDLPEWLQSKLTLAADYIQTAADYWKSEKEEMSEQKKARVPRVGEMEKALEEEVWDKPMPDSAKKGSLSPEQKAKAKARAARAGRSYPNMIDNMWASKQ